MKSTPSRSFVVKLQEFFLGGDKDYEKQPKSATTLYKSPKKSKIIFNDCYTVTLGYVIGPKKITEISSLSVK